MYSLSSYQFFSVHNNYKKLKKEGIIVQTKTQFIPKDYDVNYYQLEFETLDGRQIKKRGKCGSEKRYKEFYSNLKVIYLKDDPNNFLELPYFENYSLGYKIFFFFGLYGLIGTYVLYNFLIVGHFFKDKKNRQQFKKRVDTIIKK